MSDIPPKSPFIQEQNLPDDVLIDIFRFAEPNTVVRCRALSRFWKQMLSPYSFTKDVTLSSKDKHSSVFLKIGLPPWSDRLDFLCKIDVESAIASGVKLPFECTTYGSWNIIGSGNGMVCLRHIDGGFSTQFIVWNPLTNWTRVLDDPAAKQCCHAIFGYAFSYLPNTDHYYIAYVTKTHYRDTHFHYHVFDSNTASWHHGQTIHWNLHKLGYHNVFFEGLGFHPRQGKSSST
ncbi:hypothetical protein PIB30_001396 [Stylosanthes scabra]|uniref:F-box domain-containing protein n=1 Tax=Stylosanthes scabra TaxID=79078 RepID=A0ABU6Z3J7_9FABA|nr:hypothetical protein [Stylosanthes scabra]